MTEPAHKYTEESIASLLPDRTHTELPVGVQFFLSICETAIISHRYQHWHLDEPQTQFCEGVLDYWWEDMAEPSWDMLFRVNLKTGERSGFPSHKRFCYMQGAIVGYQLRQTYESQISAWKNE